ncbi:hypothetical protein KLH91_15900, partial [Weizmannia coagulans]|nr:hypothetical protein [Heyndrickxia coagulans]MBT2238908.1 hypothetical protein [Heyndrickxia coagulans]
VHIIILNFQIDFFSGPGGFKKTKGPRVAIEMSFWRFQKDKSGLVGVQNVFLEVSKGQKRLG